MFLQDNSNFYVWLILYEKIFSEVSEKVDIFLYNINLLKNYK